MYALLADEGRLMLAFLLNSDSDEIERYHSAVRERPSTAAKKRLGLSLSPRDTNPIVWNPRDGWVSAASVPKNTEAQGHNGAATKAKRPPLPFMRK